MKLDRNAVIAKAPELFLQPVIEFTVPLALQELDDSSSATQKFRAIPLFGVLGVRCGDSLRVPGVPKVLGDLDLLCGQLDSGERWDDAVLIVTPYESVDG